MKKGYCLMLVVILCMLPLLTGCWNAKEIEHMFYVHAVGIDYQNGQYVTYSQILNFATLAKAESGGQSGEEPAIALGKGVGDTLDTAIHNLYATSQRRIYWGHLNVVILTDKVLQKGMEDVIDLLVRFNETRGTVWVFGTNESVKDILLSIPVIEKSPVYSRLGDPRDVYHQSSTVPPIRFHRFMADTGEPDSTVVLPSLSPTKGQWTTDKKKPILLEYNGVLLLRNGQWSGWLPESAIKGIKWMNEHTSRSPLVIYKEGKPTAVLILESPKTKILPQAIGSKPRFDIHIKCTGTIIEMNQTVSESFLKQEAEKEIANEIRKTYREGLKIGADVYRLSSTMYRKSPEAWHKLLHDGKLPLAENSIQNLQVQVKIQSAGTAMMKGNRIRR